MKKHKIIILLHMMIVAYLISGCSNMVMHSPEKARVKATAFLTTLFVDADYMSAYSLTSSDFRSVYEVGYLQGLVDNMKLKYRKIEGVKANFYFQQPGQKELIAFYDCISEKGILYSKVTLVKNFDDKGINYEYIVTGVIASGLQHEQYRTAKPFKNK